MSTNRSELSDLEHAKAFVKELFNKCVDGYEYSAEDVIELMTQYDIAEHRPMTAEEAAEAEEWGATEGDGGVFLKDPWK